MSKKLENLTPTQRKVKQPRRVRYDGKRCNLDPETARLIIELYMVHGLGYSPIRHILGLPTEKRIEDVVRQHMLGRNNVDGEAGELLCPSVSHLSDDSARRIKEICYIQGTLDDDYIQDMLEYRRWYDDPVYPSKFNTCKCGKEKNVEWSFCPYCGASY